MKNDLIKYIAKRLIKEAFLWIAIFLAFFIIGFVFMHGMIYYTEITILILVSCVILFHTSAWFSSRIEEYKDDYEFERRIKKINKKQ